MSAGHHPSVMDDVRLGRQLRALRRHLALRQSDVAVRAGVSASTISLIERGFLGRLSIVTVRRIAGAVGAEFDGFLRWRGGTIDRLLDARHAILVEALVGRLRAANWDVAAEVTYARYGERGSIDALGFHRPTRVALVGEIKSEITSIEPTGRKLDEKARIARTGLIEERFGMRPVAVGRLLVLPATDSARRIVARHAATFEAMLPDRGTAVRQWLRSPDGPIAGILFVADTNGGGVTGPRRAPLRIRVSSSRSQ